jgi:4-hydroxy-tetrahydrodipicolinate synthase
VTDQEGALSGTWFVVPTPFHDDGSLDLESQRRLVRGAMEWDIDGLTVMGVTSEASSLSADERSAALDAIAATATMRVPVVVGCSAADADAVASLVADAGARGAVAAMVAAPSGLKDVGELPSFFVECRGRGGLPLVIQDEPAATGVRMSVDVLRACVETAGARTVKLESPPTAPKIAALLASDPALRLFGGLGGAYALAELRAGASGTMTGFAFPEIMAAIRRAGEAGDWRQAAALYDRYLPLIQFEAQPVSGLTVRKELLRRRGVIATARCRREPVEIDDVTRRELEDVLDRVGIEPTVTPILLDEVAR